MGFCLQQTLILSSPSEKLSEKPIEYAHKIPPTHVQTQKHTHTIQLAASEGYPNPTVVSN